MAAMTTALTGFSSNGNSKTYTYTGHTAAEPRLVIQKRRVATSGTSVLEDNLSVISSTEDAAGVLLASKIGFSANVRRPVNGIAGDVTAALATFRDLVASDEFAQMVTTQNWVKP